jgi:hypothetical protein
MRTGPVLCNQHLSRDWVIVSKVTLFVGDLGRILVVPGGF